MSQSAAVNKKYVDCYKKVLAANKAMFARLAELGVDAAADLPFKVIG